MKELQQQRMVKEAQEAQARLHSRMAEWAALSPQQRTLARMNFAESQKVETDDKRAKWEAYQALPPEEKPLWHSHVHEVKSGQLIAPGIPDLAEHELMEKLVRTYGKTWHTWHTDAHAPLPLGVPQLMMGFTADGQLDPARVADRDRRFGISSAQNARNAVLRIMLAIGVTPLLSIVAPGLKRPAAMRGLNRCAAKAVAGG